MKYLSFIQRDWRRTEMDDYKLNVQARLNDRTEAHSVTYDCGETKVVGWVIVQKFE